MDTGVSDVIVAFGSYGAACYFDREFGVALGHYSELAVADAGAVLAACRENRAAVYINAVVIVLIVVALFKISGSDTRAAVAAVRRNVTAVDSDLADKAVFTAADTRGVCSAVNVYRTAVYGKRGQALVLIAADARVVVVNVVDHQAAVAVDGERRVTCKVDSLGDIERRSFGKYNGHVPVAHNTVIERIAVLRHGIGA